MIKKNYIFGCPNFVQITTKRLASKIGTSIKFEADRNLSHNTLPIRVKFAFVHKTFQ